MKKRILRFICRHIFGLPFTSGSQARMSEAWHILVQAFITLLAIIISLLLGWTICWLTFSL